MNRNSFHLKSLLKSVKFTIKKRLQLYKVPAKKKLSLCGPSSVGTMRIFLKPWPSYKHGNVIPLGEIIFVSNSTFPTLVQFTFNK